MALAGTALAAAMLLSAGPGFAQPTSPTPQDADPSSDEAATLDEIIITGTSIP